MEDNMSNLTSTLSGDATVSSDTSIYPQQHYFSLQNHDHDDHDHDHDQQQPPPKKKRSLPGNPDPDAEVIAMSPKSLLATNRFVCEICNKGFQRDQNLQLHRRGHNLPWKLKQRSNKDVIRKKVYVCPEISCVHHHPSRALGDLTGIKKHFCRKHGDKKWKCDKCSKRYAVQSDWKAHSKVCGTREYRCDCGTLFSRRDSFITHRAFCDALAEETARSITTNSLISIPSSVVLCEDPSSTSHFINIDLHHHQQQQALQFNSTLHNHENNNNNNPLHSFPLKREQHTLINLPPWLSYPPSSSSSSSSLVGPSPTSAIDQHHQHLMINSSHSPSPSSSSSLFFHQQDSHYHHHQKENPNPSSSSMAGPTSIGTPVGNGPYNSQVAAHMSATALLQKAAEMGATMSKTAGVSSSATLQQHFQSHMTDTNSNTTTNAGLFGLKLPLFGNKPTETTTGSVQEQFPGSSSFIHDMLINPISSSSYDDAFGIGGMLTSSKKGTPFETFHRTPGGQTNNHNDGLTRDFLGLRPLSHNDILTIAGLGNCMSNNATTTSPPNPNSSDNYNNPWQG